MMRCMCGEAVLKAGGAYLPMDPNYPEQRLVYMAKDAEATVLLTHQGLTCRLPDGNLLTEVSVEMFLYHTLMHCIILQQHRSACCIAKCSL